MATAPTDELRLNRQSESKFTYFIQSGMDGPIKIGVASNVKKRLAHLQNAHPHPLRVLGILQFNVEELLHCKFQQHRLSGEWFKPSKEIFDYIEEMAARPYDVRLASLTRAARQVLDLFCTLEAIPEPCSQYWQFQDRPEAVAVFARLSSAMVRLEMHTAALDRPHAQQKHVRKYLKKRRREEAERPLLTEGSTHARSQQATR